MTRNPVKLTTPLTASNSYKAQGFLDEEQSKQLLGALEECDFQFKLMITLLLFTGARAGEICGMTWDCIDFENKCIFIENALVYVPKKGHYLHQPKTRKSERYVAIPDFLIELLKQHKDTRVVLNPALEKMCFIAPEGGYYGESGLNKRFKKLCAKIGFSDEIHVHSLRHTAASIMINSDIPSRVISEQLGHASTVITENVYGHVFAQSKVKAMQAIEMKLNRQ